jgi:hypothetical protein
MSAEVRTARLAPGSLAALPIGEGCELLAAAKLRRKRPDNVLGLLVRSLTHQEIAIMEGRGCRCDDWSLIRVAEDFDPFRVRRSHLVGACVLGRFQGEIAVLPGINLPTGIYGSTLIGCQVGNDCLIEDVRFAAHQVIESGALLFDVGSITSSGAARFGCGQELSLGIESGGREVPAWSGLGVAEAEQLALDRHDRNVLDRVSSAVAALVEQITSPVGWVRKGASVRHVRTIHDAYIGAGAVIDQLNELADSAVLSTAAEPVRLDGGSAIRHSLLHRGVRVSGSAIVRNAVLCQHSEVDCHATVSSSLVGPNSQIAKGEVTASLLGPFTGLHHQSLLISALWPAGKGNIAYGAMVGSNHTGRAPDQECRPGEGVFFGLGCSIKFPTDLSKAPYTIIGSGTVTLAQRVEFPFSLIATPVEVLPPGDGERVPRAFNEIQPAWGLYANAYAINRMELKLAKRDRTRDRATPYQVLRPSIVALVEAAHDRLTAVRDLRPLYLEEEIPGLGKNLLRESARLRAIEAYAATLRRYALRVLLAEAEGHQQLPGSIELAERLADRFMPGTDLAQRLDELLRIETWNAEVVARAKIADDARGSRIIDGYADAHCTLDDDTVVRDARERVTSTTARVRVVLGRA